MTVPTLAGFLRASGGLAQASPFCSIIILNPDFNQEAEREHGSRFPGSALFPVRDATGWAPIVFSDWYPFPVSFSTIRFFLRL